MSNNDAKTYCGAPWIWPQLMHSVIDTFYRLTEDARLPPIPSQDLRYLAPTSRH